MEREREDGDGWRGLRSGERVSNQIMTHSWGGEWRGRGGEQWRNSPHPCALKTELNEGRDEEQDGDGGNGKAKKKNKKDLPGKPCGQRRQALNKKKINKSPNTKY